MSTRTSSSRTAAAALVYWLLVMCGLAGLSVVRMDAPREFVPLWIGSVVGVALGQTLAWLRLRVWLITVLTIGLLSVSPIVFALLFMAIGSYGGGLDTCLLAFVPAAVCGYLSLSERAGLVAFWYPAMLWMLVILDRPGAGAFDSGAALPLAVGLGALFVVFLRTRETRRTAIWRDHATVRLAEPLSRTVLRVSPFRSASQHAWTGLVGAAALVLAAWVAPHLWQKEAARRPHASAMQPGPETLTPTPEPGGEPCCTSEDLDAQRLERVREYFPLTHGRDGDVYRAPRAPCAQCQSGKRPRVASGGARGTYSPTMKGYASEDGVMGGYGPIGYTSNVGAGGYGAAGYGAGGYATGGDATGGHQPGTYETPPSTPDVTPEVTPPLSPTPPLAPSPHRPAHHATPSPAPEPATADLVATPPPMPSEVAAPKPAVVVLVPHAPAPPADTGAPWRSALALCACGLALHVLLRAARRQLTLRHLARPFWSETLDQRISNHWQRMLIGLRDAGIHSSADEQPQALAKRVGIEGMSTCATILERVRHGVRVDATDLDAMSAAASAVYRAARAKAGAAGRAAALVRSPL